VQCPVFKGTLTSVDDSKARGLPGVRRGLPRAQVGGPSGPSRMIRIP